MTTNYLKQRVDEFKEEDAAYEAWYSSLSYKDKEAFELLMKSVMTKQEYAAIPPPFKGRTPEKIMEDDEMLDKTCRGEITIEQYIRYKHPKNKKQLTAIYYEIDARFKRLIKTAGSY